MPGDWGRRPGASLRNLPRQRQRAQPGRGRRRLGALQRGSSRTAAHGGHGARQTAWRVGVARQRNLVTLAVPVGGNLAAKLPATAKEDVPTDYVGATNASA